jgi:hypothetical protein
MSWRPLFSHHPTEQSHILLRVRIGRVARPVRTSTINININVGIGSLHTGCATVSRRTSIGSRAIYGDSGQVRFPVSSATTDEAQQEEQQQDLDEQEQSSRRRTGGSSSNSRGSRPLTVGEVGANWYDGACSCVTLTIKYGCPPQVLQEAVEHTMATILLDLLAREEGEQTEEEISAAPPASLLPSLPNQQP